MRMVLIWRQGDVAVPANAHPSPAMKGIACGALLGSACWAAIIGIVFGA